MDAVERQLGELTQVQFHRGIPTSRTESTGDLPVLSVAALRNGDEPHRYVNRDVLESELRGGTLAAQNDVLVAVEGGTVGECLVVPWDDYEFVPSQQVATIRVSQGSEIDPWYLGAWLTSYPGRMRLLMLARGSAIQRIAFADLQQLEVPVPEIGEQKRIGDRYRAFSASILAHQEAVSELLKLRDSDLVLAFVLEDAEDQNHRNGDHYSDSRSTVRSSGSVSSTVQNKSKAERQ